MIIKRRKCFSEEEKKGMSTGAKLALGAAAIGGGLLAAKHGAFGASAQKGVGKGMMSLGMKTSGAKTMAEGQAKIVNKALVGNGKQAMQGDALNKYKENFANQMINKSNGVGAGSKVPQKPATLMLGMNK